MLASYIVTFVLLCCYGGPVAVAVLLIVLLPVHGLLWAFARTYQWKSAVMLDRLVNVEWLNGSPDESISARAAYSAQEIPPRWWGCLLCKLLDKISKGHCQRVIANTPRHHYEPVG